MQARLNLMGRNYHLWHTDFSPRHIFVELHTTKTVFRFVGALNFYEISLCLYPEFCCCVVARGEKKYCLDSKILLSLKSAWDRMMASDDQEEYVIASEAGSLKDSQ